MGGTIQGGKMAAKTNKAKYGPEFYRVIGHLGGKKGRTGGFYGNSERASIAGAKGGKRSVKKPRAISAAMQQKRREIQQRYEHLAQIHLEAKRRREHENELQTGN